MQGLYRITDATQALLKAGGTLAVKDGANLGTVFSSSGRIIAQARLIPVNAVSAARNAAAIGPALAIVALQMQLVEVAGLVETNIALRASQVLATVRHGQWAELTALVATVDQVVDRAREIGSVPTSLWDTVTGSEASLRKQLDLYRMNVDSHVRQIQRTVLHTATAQDGPGGPDRRGGGSREVARVLDGLGPTGHIRRTVRSTALPSGVAAPRETAGEASSAP
ncbi:hypothetical protein SMICM304S_07398 [Streptomyces microflavus]